MTPQSYPLAWPAFRPRTPADKRRAGQFTKADRKIQLKDAVIRLEDELDRLGAVSVIISTNLQPTLSGRPKANMGSPDDPGVAIYFTLEGEQVTLACDTFTELAQNVAGLAAHIEATRRIDRYGVQKASEIFRAFEALPPPTGRSWRNILGMKGVVTVEDVKRRKRELAARHHPDRGGNPDQLAEINAAADAAIKEIGNV